MRRGLAALVAAAAAAAAFAACGGAEGGRAPAEQPLEATPIANPGGSTKAQLEYRAELLAQLESGTYGDCGCTAEARAKDRIARGLVEGPPADRTLSEQPEP